MQDPRTGCPFAGPGLKPWGEPGTWGGAVPSPGSIITLPHATKVLLGACDVMGKTFKQIVVPEGSEVRHSGVRGTYSRKRRPPAYPPSCIAPGPAVAVLSCGAGLVPPTLTPPNP